MIQKGHSYTACLFTLPSPGKQCVKFIHVAGHSLSDHGNVSYSPSHLHPMLTLSNGLNEVTHLTFSRNRHGNNP